MTIQLHLDRGQGPHGSHEGGLVCRREVSTAGVRRKQAHRDGRCSFLDLEHLTTIRSGDDSAARGWTRAEGESQATTWGETTTVAAICTRAATHDGGAVVAGHTRFCTNGT